MIELLSEVNYWHWLALGLLLLAGELLGTAGYFLWLGISALIVGALLSVLPLGWELQWVTFATLCMSTTWLWWRRQFSADKSSDADRDLNQKQKQMVGLTVVLENDIKVGSNRIKIGDTTWSAKSTQNIAIGEQVKVVSMDGIILTIEKVV